MKSSRVHILYIVACLLFLIGCKPSVPREYIQPDDMEDILYDYFVSQGMASVHDEGSRPDADMDHSSEDYKRDLYFNAVLKKYGLTRADFDSSLVYYYTRADRFVKICQNVQERLSEDALAQGASEGEVERFMLQNSLSGDTADVWEGNRSAMLMPYQPYHYVQFYQKADTSYRKGDSFMLSFKSDFLYQGGSKDAVAYLAMKYANDSILSSAVHFSTSGNQQVRIGTCDLPVKEVSGFIYIGDGREKTSNLRLVFLSDIQLIRFHQKKDNSVAKPAGEEKPQSDSVKTIPDSLRPRPHRLGERPMPANAVRLQQ